jgi:hypothetical protein
MRTQVATEPGSATAQNEDRSAVALDTVVVIDGATARTDTGCVHGVAWYAEQLAAALLRHRSDGPAAALTAAIRDVADLHRGTCDLDHPGSPSAAVGIVEVSGDELRYLVLADVSVAIDTGAEIVVICDDRVSRVARPEREAAAALPFGSPEKAAARVLMRRTELAARNTPGGYWVAGSDPAAVAHALTGTVPLSTVRRVALLTDGAARAVDSFQLHDWRTLLDLVADRGPATLLAQVRAAEAGDPQGVRWPRNKISDDATVAYCDGFVGAEPNGISP